MSNPQANQPNPLGPAVESRPGLLRALGPGMAIAVVVGNVIGSGIFVKPGQIADDGGEFGLIISVWVIGGVLCAMGSLCLAELAVMLPSTAVPKAAAEVCWRNRRREGFFWEWVISLSWIET